MLLIGENLLMDSKLLREDITNWWIDRMYLQDVWKLASHHSTDPRTQVGSALVVPNGGIVVSSWNGIPQSIRMPSSYTVQDHKNFYTEHAERSVIFKAIKNNLPTSGLHMYTTWASCSECARAIIEFGIKRVVTFRRLVERTSTEWEKSVSYGIQMMIDSGVDVVGWAGDIKSDRNIRFGGQLFFPENLK